MNTFKSIFLSLFAVVTLNVFLTSCEKDQIVISDILDKNTQLQKISLKKGINSKANELKKNETAAQLAKELSCLMKDEREKLNSMFERLCLEEPKNGHYKQKFFFNVQKDIPQPEIGNKTIAEYLISKNSENRALINTIDTVYPDLTILFINNSNSTSYNSKVFYSNGMIKGRKTVSYFENCQPSVMNTEHEPNLRAFLIGAIFPFGPIQAQTECSLNGATTATNGEFITFTFVTDVLNAVINWEILSGNISLVSTGITTVANGQTTQDATFLINGSGQIKASSQNGVRDCSDVLDITVVSTTCSTHVADIRAELDEILCQITIWDDAYPGNDSCGLYTYQWQVNGICGENIIPFGNSHTTGFHAQHHDGNNNFTVNVTVTNAAGSQIAPYREFNFYQSGCNMQFCGN